MTCLKEALRPWLRVNTWHQPQGPDHERFCIAMRSASEQCGYPIDGSSIRIAMFELFAEHHQGKKGDYWMNRIEAFAKQAEFVLAEIHVGPRGTTRVH